MPSAPSSHRLTERMSRSAFDGSGGTFATFGTSATFGTFGPLASGATSGVGTAVALFGEGLLERAEQQHDETRRQAGAHQPHAPDLSGERAEPRADLDVELIEQMHP